MGATHDVERSGGKARLGGTFGRLWAAVTVSGLGDGVRAGALPLLAAFLTRSPAQIAGVSFAQALPWLLFGLPSGAMADRLDRRGVLIVADVVRAVIMSAGARRAHVGRAADRTVGAARAVGPHRYSAWSALGPLCGERLPPHNGPAGRRRFVVTRSESAVDCLVLWEHEPGSAPATPWRLPPPGSATTLPSCAVTAVSQHTYAPSSGSGRSGGCWRYGARPTRRPLWTNVRRRPVRRTVEWRSRWLEQDPMSRRKIICQRTTGAAVGDVNTFALQL